MAILRKGNKRLVGLCATFALAGVAVFAASGTAGEYGLDARCPTGALAYENDEPNSINWENVRSEPEAEKCVGILAQALGPARLNDYFLSDGFHSKIMDQRYERTLISASWSVPANGPRFYPSLARFLVNEALAHGMTISVTWKQDELLPVGLTYTYE